MHDSSGMIVVGLDSVIIRVWGGVYRLLYSLGVAVDGGSFGVWCLIVVAVER